MNKEIEVKNIAEAQAKLAELNKDNSINKPSEAEVNAATDEFNKLAASFNGKKFKIGTVKQADEIFDFVLEFMEKHVYWTKNGWMGVLKMHEELTETKKNKKKNEAFRVGYQALEFLFYALTNPGGSGIESAKAIEKVANLYAEVIELAGKQLETSRKELKEVQWLQDKVTAMQQGFYLEREDGVAPPEEGKEVQGFEAPSADDLLKKE